MSLPTRARMTVSSGAAGKAMVMFISNICRRSTEGVDQGQVNVQLIQVKQSTIRLKCQIQAKPGEA